MTTRSRSFVVTGFPGSLSTPKIARMPSRRAPSQPRPAISRPTMDTTLLTVSAALVGGSRVMIPSGLSGVWTKPGRNSLT